MVTVAVVTVAASANFLRATDGISGPVMAQVLRVIDGDTIAVRAQIWIGQSVETRVRIVGVDTPELRGRCALETICLRGDRVVVKGDALLLVPARAAFEGSGSK